MIGGTGLPLWANRRRIPSFSRSNKRAWRAGCRWKRNFLRRICTFRARCWEVVWGREKAPEQVLKFYLRADGSAKPIHLLGQDGNSANRLWRRFPRSGIFENAKEQEPSFDVCRHQEVFFYVFTARGANAAREFRMRQQIADLKRAALHRVHQNSRQFMDDLIRDTSDCSGNSGLALP